MEATNFLNVTMIEPKLKHPTIFERFDMLKSGETLTLQNDHDPKPLYFQLVAQIDEFFTCNYLDQGQNWRNLNITKN